MKHHVINMAGKELKCRLDTKNTVALEKKLGGKNILKVLMDEQILSVDIVLTTLHASLQVLEHGYTMEKVYQLYDQYIEDGSTYTDLVPELINVLEASGFFKKPQEEGETVPEETA